jgi:hypothetical protein
MNISIGCDSYNTSATSNLEDTEISKVQLNELQSNLQFADHSNQSEIRTTTCRNGIMFDGACRSQRWVERNLADGFEVQSLGICEQASMCDLYYTVITDHQTLGYVLSQNSEVIMLKEDYCSGGNACINGYQMSMKITAEFTIDNEEQIFDARFDTYLGKYRNQANRRVHSEQLGYSILEITPNSRTITHFDQDDVYLAGDHANPEWYTRTELENFCEYFTSYLVNDTLIVGLSTLVGGAVSWLISSNATTAAITLNIFIPGSGAPVYVGGYVLAAGAFGLISSGTYALLKVLADRVDANQYCDDIDLFDNFDFIKDINEGFDNDVIEGEWVFSGCRVCISWEEEDTSFQTSETTEDGLVITYYDRSEKVCSESIIDVFGRDTDGDGWCDE